MNTVIETHLLKGKQPTHPRGSNPPTQGEATHPSKGKQPTYPRGSNPHPSKGKQPTHLRESNPPTQGEANCNTHKGWKAKDKAKYQQM